MPGSDEATFRPNPPWPGTLVASVRFVIRRSWPPLDGRARALVDDLAGSTVSRSQSRKA
jgi:hypothetical protein